VDWTIEVVTVPVADVDRAKEFYADRLGFAVDHDTAPSPDVRFVQLTPPGSGCSIVISRGAGEGAPGSLRGVQFVVADVDAAHAHLVAQGVDCTDVETIDPRDGGRLLTFTDPDGNAWVVQELRTRATTPLASLVTSTVGAG
jgi:catechol 2,3-dioxygenase-like lactoylglutathione lyase family enzyme